MTATTWTVKNARVKQQNPLPRYHNPRTSKSQYPTKHYFRLQNHAVGNFSFLIPHRNAAPAPHLARPRRLCQPPWTQPISRNPRPPRMGAQVRRNVQVYSHPLFGREGSGGRGASLREAASPPSSFSSSSLEEGARGRGLFFRKVPSLAYFYNLYTYSTLILV